MLKGTEKLGITGLAIHEGGLRKPLVNGACLKAPADFKGVKIRSVESPVLVNGLSALGANPTPLPLSDVYLALKQGTVDAMEANLGLVYTQKFYEVTKCITGNVNLWPFPTVLGINTERWNSLSEEEQGWLTDAAAEIDDDVDRDPDRPVEHARGRPLRHRPQVRHRHAGEPDGAADGGRLRVREVHGQRGDRRRS